MKTLEEVSQLLSSQEPSDPLVKLLNETFGPLGWELDGSALKVMVKVSEGHFLTVTRRAQGFESSAALFGLEVRNAPVQECAEVAAGGDRVGQGAGEPEQAVPAGTPKPSRKVIMESISACSQVILAKKLRTQEDLVRMVQMFQVKRKEELNDAQAEKLLEQLKEVLK